MKKIFNKEVLIGLSVIVALAILFIGIQFLKGVNIFSSANYYSITYDNVQGLAISAPVNLNGYKVGIVRDIAYDYNNPGHVNVEIEVNDNLKLPKGTHAYIESDLLGTASVTLLLGTEKDFYTSGDRIPGSIKAGMMDNISGAMDNILPSVGTILPRIDSLLMTLNQVVANPAIPASLNNVNTLTTNLEQASRDLTALLSTLPPITHDVKSITGNFSQTSENLNAMSAELRNLPVDSLMNSLQMSVDNLKVLTQQLNNPNSTLGLLTHDPALYNNLNSTVRSLDSLFTDIKANPKRYINIKVF